MGIVLSSVKVTNLTNTFSNDELEINLSVDNDSAFDRCFKIRVYGSSGTNTIQENVLDESPGLGWLWNWNCIDAGSIEQFSVSSNWDTEWSMANGPIFRIDLIDEINELLVDRVYITYPDWTVTTTLNEAKSQLTQEQVDDFYKKYIFPPMLPESEETSSLTKMAYGLLGLAIIGGAGYLAFKYLSRRA